MAKLPRIKDLYCDTVLAQSIPVDWSERYDADDEGRDGWTCYEAMTCEKCGALVVQQGQRSGGPHNELDPESECKGYVATGEGPMMAYAWPLTQLRLDYEDAARAVAHLPVCIVRLDGADYLALTGGGMDLSWELCEAYMLLGMLPPRDLRLPDMAMGYTPRRRWVVAGKRKAIKVCRAWLDGDARDLAHTVKRMRERDAKRG